MTGVTGFLGAYLIEALQGYSHRIYCFIRADNEEIAWYKLMTNLNDYFSEETVEMMLSNIEVIVGRSSVWMMLFYQKTWIRLFVQYT